MSRIVRRSLSLSIALAFTTLAGAAAAEPAFNAGDIDRNVDACADFNAYVNGKWVAENPIPSDRTRWGAFDQLREQSLNAQQDLVNAAETVADMAGKGSLVQKIGWLYRSGMNEAAIEKAGMDPIRPEIWEIDRLQNGKDVANWIGKAYAEGNAQLFSFGSSADYQDARRQIAFTFESGLGLPTRDYYSDEQYADIRRAYRDYIAQIFTLAGDDAKAASDKADSVLAFETQLAAASLSNVERRDPKNQYKFVSIAEANEITPHFDWSAFFKAQGLTVKDGFSMGQPAFFAEVDRLLAKAPVSDWRNYLAFHTIDDAAPYLSSAFQNASFGFHDKALNGQPEQRARWKRVLDVVNGSMGQALGQLYVDRYFPPEAKERALELVNNVHNALKVRIENLDWMSDATKAKALEKWSTFLPKIGYPDKWRDWSGLSISPDNFYANIKAAAKFNHAYDIAKIGTATDRMEWGMSPQTVNAYYSGTSNTINFPAAILQPPFFYADGDDAINYGAIGGVIGHEASHGFDDKGSKFDSAGNNANWWTDEDRAKFEARADKLVEQFEGYAPLADHPDKHVNGRLTLGENIADLGGLSVAYDALQAALKADPAKKAEIDGFTQEQRFFLSWGRVWRGSIRDEAQLVRLNSDSHSPMKFRAIGAPSNMDAFAAAFACTVGDAMVRDGEKKVRIW
ncbi:MAG: M13 family metallopeptidase [Lysobacteraceae bacterium]